MTGVDRLLQTARNEIGYLEKASNSQLDSKTANAGKNNFTKYARDLDKLGVIYNGAKNGYEWCDVFVDWCFITAFGLELGMKLLCQVYRGAGAGCPYSAQYYKNSGRFYTSNPQPGDQIFFKNSSGFCHTGIVEKVQNGLVYTIEGNTSNASGVISNGGGVARKSYYLNYSMIGGYGRPNWSLVGDTSGGYVGTTTSYQAKVSANGGLNCRTAPINGAVIKTYPNGSTITIKKENNGWGYTGEGWVSLTYVQRITPITTTKPDTTKEDDDDMDVKRFKELWNEMRKELKDNDASSYSKEARDWAVKNGIITGGSAKEFNGMWEDVPTREQLVTMLYRFAKMIDKA